MNPEDNRTSAICPCCPRGCLLEALRCGRGRAYAAGSAGEASTEQGSYVHDSGHHHAHGRGHHHRHKS